MFIEGRSQQQSPSYLVLHINECRLTGQCLNISLCFIARGSAGIPADNLRIKFDRLGTIHTHQTCGEIEKLLSLAVAIIPSGSSLTSKKLHDAEYNRAVCDDIVATTGAAYRCHVTQERNGGAANEPKNSMPHARFTLGA